jgi:hypothetical protein
MSNHGRVRVIKRHGPNDEDGYGVTLAGTEHVLLLSEALGLANALIFTAVYGEERNMRDNGKAKR